ncbi:MAG TPA: hypothetical protein VI278_14115, partial [Nitrososphaeraceae archaeon]
YPKSFLPTRITFLETMQINKVEVKMHKVIERKTFCKILVPIYESRTSITLSNHCLLQLQDTQRTSKSNQTHVKKLIKNNKA